MIKDPLTKEQKKEFIEQEFQSTFNKEYESLLKDTCIDPEDDRVEEGSFAIARIALNRAAKPPSKDFRKLCD